MNLKMLSPPKIDSLNKLLSKGDRKMTDDLNEKGAKCLHLLSQIDNLGQQFNVTSDWIAREVIKQQIITLAQELDSAKGKYYE